MKTFSPPLTKEEVEYMKTRLMHDYPIALQVALSKSEEEYVKTDKIATSIIHKLQKCNEPADT
jgi:hypothetical protein